MLRPPRYRRLLGALDQQPELLARWRERFAQSRLRTSRAVDEDEIAPLVNALLEGLVFAMPVVRPNGREIPGDLTPGSAHTRELEKAAGFVGGALAARGVSGFEVAAAVLALRDVLLVHAEPPADDELIDLFEWLHVVALNAHGTARVMGTEEATREQLEKGTPVVLIAPSVPAALLVGAPDSVVLDNILSRLLLIVVRSGAAVTIVDASGLQNPAAEQVLRAIHRFAAHDKIAGRVDIAVVGLTREQQRLWEDAIASAGATMLAEEQLCTAVTVALERSGHEIRRRVDA